MASPMTTIGIVHTLLSLPPVIAGLWCFFRQGKIDPNSRAGKVYLTGLVLSVFSSFALYWFTPIHALGIVSLLAAFGGWWVLGVSPLGRARPYLSAFGLTFSFFSRTGNIDRYGDLNFRMQRDDDLVQTDGLDRMVQFNLVAVQGEAVGGDDFSNVAGRNRTVELTGFTSRTDDDEAFAIKLFGNGQGFILAFEILGLKLGALAFELLLVGFIGAQGLALWQQEVTGIAVLDLYNVAHLAEAANAFQKNDFHWSFLSGFTDYGLPAPGSFDTGAARDVSKRPRTRKMNSRNANSRTAT